MPGSALAQGLHHLPQGSDSEAECAQGRSASTTSLRSSGSRRSSSRVSEVSAAWHSPTSPPTHRADREQRVLGAVHHDLAQVIVDCRLRQAHLPPVHTSDIRARSSRLLCRGSRLKLPSMPRRSTGRGRWTSRPWTRKTQRKRWCGGDGRWEDTEARAECPGRTGSGKPQAVARCASCLRPRTMSRRSFRP